LLTLGARAPDNVRVTFLPKLVATVVAGAVCVGISGSPVAAGGRAGAAAYTAPAFAARVPATTTQVIRTVRTDRWCAKRWCTHTQAWEKRDGMWRVARLVTGEGAVFRSSIGPSGFRSGRSRREGDGSTPSGVFPIVVTFSTSASAPGAMPWRRRLPTSVVSGAQGRLYNTWMEQSGRTDGNRPTMRWGFWVGFNNPRLQAGKGPRPVPGRGSGIFYHTSKPGHRWRPTEGCTSLGNPADIQWVLGWLRPDADPRVVQHT
jgi:L,D-peptidoglycan transpeptidase YkuD (ErfK/YbiS/YcfS/YnhG family)